MTFSENDTAAAAAAQPPRLSNEAPSFVPSTTPSDEKYTREVSPFSPFYSHDTIKGASKAGVDVYETDVEACLTNSQTNVLNPTTTNRTGYTTTQKTCTVWPGTEALRKRSLAEKKARGWHPLAGFEKRTQVIIKIIIAILLIGGMVGLGLGVSKAVGASIWKTNASTSNGS